MVIQSALHESYFKKITVKDAWECKKKKNSNKQEIKNTK